LFPDFLDGTLRLNQDIKQDDRGKTDAQAFTSCPPNE
jgi:hypothetical protein